MIDLHTHVLPGLDDGPTEMAAALAMCRLAVEDGTTTMVATPHMLGGLYDVGPEAVVEGVRSLRKRLKSERVALAIEPGADVHIDPNLCEHLRRQRVLTVGGRTIGAASACAYILLELPQGVIPTALADLLFSVQVMGVTPMISHPERNFEIQNDPDAVRPLVEAGTVLQVTAGSITGDFGGRAQRCAHYLLKARLAHVVASDAHSPRTRPPGLSRARAEVARLLSPEETDDIFVERPKRILAGDFIQLPEPTDPRHKGRRAWFSWRR